ncbi:MAG: hypothetical protein RR851_14615, partial [Clostridium sp.]
AFNTGAKIADKLETMALTAMYAKDFVISLAKGTGELIKQAAQFAFNTGAKIADKLETMALTVATAAWNAVCSIATGVTTALGVAIKFLAGPIGLIILAIGSVIVIGVLLVKHWGEVKSFAAEIWGSIKNTIGGAIDGIKNAVAIGLNFVKNIFSTVFNGIWNVVKKVINMILGGIDGLVNGVIRGINFMVRALNKLRFDVPDWIPGIGGAEFGFNLPELGEINVPRLATGGYVKANQPQLAMIGDNKTQGEIVAPEGKMMEVMTQALSAFFSKMEGQQGGNNSSGNGDLTVQLVISDTKLGEVMVRSFRKLERRTGKVIFNL